VTEDEATLPKHSINYGVYFQSLSDEVERIYEVAEAARAKGVDPVERVEIPPAHDVAARVEATLDGPIGVAKRIRELSKKKKGEKDKSREEVAFAVAKEIALGELGGITDEEKAADKAVRVALAILTESITAAPLEGISKVRIRGSGPDRYLALYLAGPIRAAGGTEAAVTVLVADHVRQVLKLPAFRASEEEIERSLEEVELYARNVHLQHSVYPDLIKSASAKLPIMLTGEPTEDFEVSAGRDLDRIETNRVRSGSVLVLNDGVVGRAAKLAKIVHRLGMDGWNWLDEIAEKTSKAKSSEDEAEASKLTPKDDYLADVIGGRPVFSHPSRIGGFRLRYGRSRNTGLAGVGTHPATMLLVEGFLAPGTHIRTERPGKGSIVAPVDTIEGPIVLLEDDTVRQIHTYEEAKQVQDKIKRIIALGDILIGLGEFLENNHPLAPSGYCEEWWSHELDDACAGFSRSELETKLAGTNITPEEMNAFIESPLTRRPAPSEAVSISRNLGVPLHPRYLYRWLAISKDEAVELRSHIIENHTIQETNDERYLVIPSKVAIKRILEKAGIPHTPLKGRKIRFLDEPDTILLQMGNKRRKGKGSTALEFLNSVCEIELRDKVGFSIGARMGRPEKALVRKMRPPVQVLFPVGRAMGTERNIERVAEGVQPVMTLESFDPESPDTPPPLLMPQLSLELVTRSCPDCQNETFESRCPVCGGHTDVQYWCSQEDCGLYADRSTGMCPRGHDVNLIRGTRYVPVDMQGLLDRLKTEVGEPQTYGVRGVLGLTSDLKIPEYLGKGILRAKHDVYCYRDGTARFDATDAPLTHFTPAEVGVPFHRLRELGYDTDIDGEPLNSDDQILELKVQDVVIPENCGDYLVQVGKFVDDSLEKIYGVGRYYNFEDPEDVVGELIIGLAPHTSAGIIGRVIGFTTASMCYAHPYWHAAKRRNCDGDEDALILVLDALLNFSRAYLPKGRGGFMDAPLVLSVILNPSEVDDESHNIEVCRRYPSEFYDMVHEAQHPRVVEHLVDIIASRLDTEAQYEGFGFTHGTSSINVGPVNTKYKILGSMAEKLGAQLHLAKLIDAVDTADVAERVLSGHFLRDIRGNLRAYSTQKIRCVKCNRIYRRIPLSGMCSCGSKLSLTVRQRNISKYLEIAQKMIDDYGLGIYLQQRLKLISSSLDSLFVSEQTTLTEFFEDESVTLGSQ
jgi:DNA polymerase II large subunit